MRGTIADGSLAAERAGRNVGKERSLAAEEPLEMWGKVFFQTGVIVLMLALISRIITGVENITGLLTLHIISA